MEIKLCSNDAMIQALADTAKDIWNEYFINIITQEQIDYMVEKFQSVTALSKAIKEEGYTYYMAYDQDRVIGFCGIKVEGSRLFLSKLYVRKEMRGKKVSSKLLNKAIVFAQEHDCTAIYLTCNKYNTNSLELYAYKGFHTIDSVQTDIGHGFIMDDYILQLDLI